ncbi:glutathione S-transferase family protein [Methylobacterium sp. JK268]
MPTLVIANKRYSSWSLRPWLMLRQAGIAFEEVLIPLDREDTRERILAHSPAGRVPVLIDGGVTVWESLAILDYAAETWPEAGVWPSDRAARALARAISAEMHAGFAALRSALPMNLGRRYAARDRGAAVAADIGRIQAIWRDARARFGQGGPFLFGAFGAADAMFAPVVTRFDTYAVAVDPEIRAYMDAVLGLPAFREWRDAALREPWILKEVDEPPVETLGFAAPGKE